MPAPLTIGTVHIGNSLQANRTVSYTPIVATQDAVLLPAYCDAKDVAAYKTWTYGDDHSISFVEESQAYHVINEADLMAQIAREDTKPFTVTDELAQCDIESMPAQIHCDNCANDLPAHGVLHRTLYGEDVVVCSHDCLSQLTTVWHSDTTVRWAIEYAVEHHVYPPLNLYDLKIAHIEMNHGKPAPLYATLDDCPYCASLQSVIDAALGNKSTYIVWNILSDVATFATRHEARTMAKTLQERSLAVVAVRTVKVIYPPYRPDWADVEEVTGEDIPCLPVPSLPISNVSVVARIGRLARKMCAYTALVLGSGTVGYGIAEAISHFVR